MTNLGDVTPFFDGVWVASPFQGEGESEGFLHGNRYVGITLTSVLSPCLRGEAERPGRLQRSRVDAQTVEAGDERAGVSGPTVGLIPVFRSVVLITVIVRDLRSSLEEWPQDRVWKRIHRCVRQDRHKHAAFRVIENPRHDERHGGDPEDEKGHVENAGYGPLATEPNGHVPNSPKDPKDETRRQRSVALLEVWQREAAPTDLFEKWSADEQRWIDIKDQVRHQFGLSNGLNEGKIPGRMMVPIDMIAGCQSGRTRTTEFPRAIRRSGR